MSVKFHRVTTPRQHTGPWFALGGRDKTVCGRIVPTYLIGDPVLIGADPTAAVYELRCKVCFRGRKV